MFFNHENKKYEINVEETLKAVGNPEDFYPDLEEDGVAIKDFDGKEDFSDCENVILSYNHATNKVTVQLCKEEYETIPAEITEEEVNMLREFFE